MKEKDMEELKIIKDILIRVSKNVYRDLEFFYQSENKKQRRKIYNREIEYDSRNQYGIVCNTLCKIVQEICVNEYGLNIDLISCDTDEFGHVDLLLITKSGNQYIINCLSDLERIQIGMKTTRFATEEYFDERYSKLLDKSTISFLSEEENKKIDEEIGYFNSMYMDDFFNMLKNEFGDLKNILQKEDSLRKILLGETSQAEDVENLSIEQLTNLKLKFLLDFCNKRSGLIGHIELIRIYKLLSKQLFSKDEIKEIQACDCFFDRKDGKVEEDVWNVREKRVRFLKLKVKNDVYIVTTADNTYKHMSEQEYETFREENDVYEKAITKAFGTISECIRNKGVGVNILKHAIVNTKIKEFDTMASRIPQEELESILKRIQQGNVEDINFELEGNIISVSLGEEKIIININGNCSDYSFEDDNLVEINAEGRYKYKWRDEGKYDVILDDNIEEVR